MSDIPTNDQVNELCGEVATLRARVATLEAALRDLLDYTLQIEHFVYPEDEANIDHKIVAEARRALAGERGEKGTER